MRARFIFIPFSAATAAVPPSLPAVCGAFITSPTGRFSPVTVTHIQAYTHTHTACRTGSQLSPLHSRVALHPHAEPHMGPWDSGGRERVLW